MINLSQDQIKELEVYLGEIPAKFANPILSFLGKIAQEQAPKAEEVTVETA